MSRSDVRCLVCDGRLPLYRKLTSGQFCSPAHKKAYWQEQERLAVERLHQTHSSLQSYAAATETIEQILGQPAAPLPRVLAEAPELTGASELIEAPLLVEASAVQDAPEPAGLLFARPEPCTDASPSMVASDPVEYETAIAPYRPVWAETPVLTTGELVAAAISMRGVDHVTARSPQPCELRVAAVHPRVPAPLLPPLHAPPQAARFER